MDPMSSSLNTAGADNALDIFGQSSRLYRVYTQLCFCFTLADHDSSSDSLVTNHLQGGLDRLCLQFPWVADHVIQDNAGVYRIEQDSNPIRLITQDRRGDLPSLTAYREAGFPISMLDESVVAARKTLFQDSDEPAAALVVKATFIEGGLLLNFDAQHNCVDMAGQCQLIRLFSKTCSGEALTSEEIRIGNLLNHNISSTDASRSPGPSIPPLSPPQTQQPPAPAPPKPSPSPASTTDTAWAYFLFPAPALAKLKALAAQTKITPFISTDDALSALVWQRATAARAPDLDAATLRAGSTFERLVDARQALDLPPGCPGSVVHKAALHRSYEALVEGAHEEKQEDLGALASALRHSIGSADTIAETMRATAVKMWRAQLQEAEAAAGKGEQGGQGGSSQSSSQDSAAPAAPKRKPGISAADIRMSSWAKETCCEFDFGGLLGRPDAVRRPMFPAWEGLGYFMPKARDGEIAVALCLRESAMERLKRDDLFTSFGRFVG